MEYRWQVPDPGALAWEWWGEEYALFDGNSGETHLVNELPAEVLRRLSQGPIGGLDLARSIAGDCDMECTPDWTRKIDAILRNLHTLGLIEQVHE